MLLMLLFFFEDSVAFVDGVLFDFFRIRNGVPRGALYTSKICVPP